MTPVEGRNYFTCGYCHAFHFPTELEDSADRITPLSERGDVACPICAEYLVAGALDDTRIVYCEQCRGVLIENDAFAEVVCSRRVEYTGSDHVPVPIDPAQYERKLACPRCSRRMETHPYHGPGSVAIDTCSSCHLIWLDHGEIASIERAPGQRRVPTSSYGSSSSPSSSDEKKSDKKQVDLITLFFR